MNIPKFLKIPIPKMTFVILFFSLIWASVSMVELSGVFPRWLSLRLNSFFALPFRFGTPILLIYLDILTLVYLKDVEDLEEKSRIEWLIIASMLVLLIPISWTLIHLPWLIL